MAPGNQGNKGQRAKHGFRSYYKGHYHIAFYRECDGDETLYRGFDNVAEICRYLGWGTGPKEMKSVYITLYKCLYEGGDPHTKLIDGIRLKPYLIDMSEEIEEDERRERDMKKFVKINSLIDIEVYPDLDAIDTTNPAAPMADRLSAKPNWVYPVLIKKGIHFYPSEIREWKSVKSLGKLNKLSVAEDVDDISEDDRKECEKILKTISRLKSRKNSQREESKAAKAKQADQPVER